MSATQVLSDPAPLSPRNNLAPVSQPFCKATSVRTGKRCGLKALGGAEFCYSHDPRNEAARKVTGIKAGTASGSVKTETRLAEGSVSMDALSIPQDIETPREVARMLRDGAAWMLCGDLEPKRATALNQIGATLLRCIEASRQEQAIMKCKIKFGSSGEVKSREVTVEKRVKGS